MKKVSILGSTGSIGTQAVDVVRRNRDMFKIVGLSAGRSIDLLYEQIIEFEPSIVSVSDDEDAVELKRRLGDRKVIILAGEEGLIDVAQWDETELVLVSLVGMIGLVPTIKAIEKGKIVALANKETLVSGGLVVKEALKSSRSKLIPVDSEHCAIFQCLQCSNKNKEIQRIILTASGGPFRGRKYEELQVVTLQDALKHPNWSMGRKITIDSATLMNKGLEVIEAHWLFDTDFDKISVVVHPQSIIHSMVEYIDGSVLAQLGTADMRTPILYALSYPERVQGAAEELDFMRLKPLTFEEPDFDTFRCLKLAYDAGIEGGTMPVVLNAANEAAVDLFLKGIIKFTDIQHIVEDSMVKHKTISNPDLEDILETDKLTRDAIYSGIRTVLK